MGTKDYFSGHSKLYAAFRPTYPAELYEFIFSHVKEFGTAWDCATGNGQVAGVLSKYFATVHATDISQQQLNNAVQAKNIVYSAQPAEKINLADQSVDLITVAQSLHWFNTADFYKEVNRIAKPDAVLAVFGYAVCSINPAIDNLFLDFYNNKVGPYWDSARKLVDEEYQSIPFPFEEIQSPKFFINVQWTAEQFAGYLTTWSATQKFIKVNGYDPVPEFLLTLLPFWNEKLEVNFPLFLRLGKGILNNSKF